MKNSFFKIMVLIAGAIVLLTASSLCAETKDGNRDFWGKGNPKKGGRMELTEERIDHIMERIAERNPEEAEKLTQLRKDDPNEFKESLRRRMRELRNGRSSRRGKTGSSKKTGDGHRMGPEKPGGPGMPSAVGGRGRKMGGGIRAEFIEHIEWLEKNYPKKAKWLEKLKEKDPKQYRSRIAESFKEYRGIREAEKDNPELATILKKDLELKRTRGKLTRKIRTAKGEEKDGLVKELTEVVNSRYDLIVKRKYLEYEQLARKLAKLQEKVKQSEAKVDEWKNPEFKEKNVKDRVVELTKDSKKFKW
ncbi:hypothetical protein ACFL3G_06510 [Planctomycetota bacterium]